MCKHASVSIAPAQWQAHQGQERVLAMEIPFSLQRPPLLQWQPPQLPGPLLSLPTSTEGPKPSRAPPGHGLNSEGPSGKWSLGWGKAWRYLKGSQPQEAQKEELPNFRHPKTSTSAQIICTGTSPGHHPPQVPTPDPRAAQDMLCLDSRAPESGTLLGGWLTSGRTGEPGCLDLAEVSH